MLLATANVDIEVNRTQADVMLLAHTPDGADFIANNINCESAGGCVIIVDHVKADRAVFQAIAEGLRVDG